MATEQENGIQMFECRKEGSRKLVVCIDGTTNQFGIKNTNIIELYRHITKNDRQLTFYCSGLGTFAKVPGTSLGHRLSNAVDTAIGSNLHKNIMASYRWLSDNYQDGDGIFLFGFSRGAYQVRALAGMISRVGLLLPGNKGQIPFAFELYLKTIDDDIPSTQVPSVLSQAPKKRLDRMAHYTELAKTFQRTFCRREVHIHFVGAWDTVSSVGFGRSTALPCTTASCDHVCYFRHALALDERRVKFLPEYVYGGRSSCSDDGRIKEVWFPGRHSDVGGGSKRSESLPCGGISLTWMRSQAVAAGLEMEPVPVKWKVGEWNQRIPRSVNVVWWPLELVPFKRLLYHNSNRHTFRPHLGGPRRIYPGQKVHASVLFMNDYKPYAERLDGCSWPEPLSWNAVSIDRQLQELPDSWETNVFDRDSVRPLLLELQQSRPKLDVLDRLIFMASFDVCKDAINRHENARRILAPLLCSNEELVRLSTAATYCELEWSWPSGQPQSSLDEQIIEDLTKLLAGHEHHACIYIPFLYKRADLKAELRTEGAMQGMTTTAAFRSAQALAILMKLDPELAVNLINIDAVTDLMDGLRSDSNSTLISVLSVLDGIAKHKSGRDVMKAGPTVATLIRLIKQFDESVSRAAICVLCSLLPDDDLRATMIEFGTLPIFLDMLKRCSDNTKRSTCVALYSFAEYEDVGRVIHEQGYLRSLAQQTLSDAPSKRDIAIKALVFLGSRIQMRIGVMGAISEVCPVLVARLSQKSTALPAVLVLARLMDFDDFAIMVSSETSNAPSAIMTMLQNRWFDGVRGEDGLLVLSELLKNGRMRHAVQRAGAIDKLRNMINPAQHESTYAALHYLRVVVGINETGWLTNESLGRLVIPAGERMALVSDVVKALRVPDCKVQRTATEILQFFAAEADLRDVMVKDLLEQLRDRQAGVLLAASNVLALVATYYESVRDRVLMQDAFCKLAGEYYGGFTLEYDAHGCPPSNEVHASVGRMIRLMQMPEVENVGEGLAGGATEQMLEDNKLKWPAREPYEIKKTKSRWFWIGMLLSYPALPPERRRRLWQEE